MLLAVLALIACGDAAPRAADPVPAPPVPTVAACEDGAGLDTVPALHPSVDGYPEVRVALTPPDARCAIVMAVRLADTAATRQHGLMEVTELPDGTGMLFTYPDVEGERTGGYWMKNTLVALDIAYIGADGTVVDIRAMDPCEADPCPGYPPDAPYRATLEVPQGWFAAVGVAEGWRVTVDGAPAPDARRG